MQQANLQLLSALHSKFKDEHTFEKRKAEAERIRQKYADRIPVCTKNSPLLPFSLVFVPYIRECRKPTIARVSPL